MRRFLSSLFIWILAVGAVAQPDFSGDRTLTYDPADNSVQQPDSELEWGDDFDLWFGDDRDYGLRYDATATQWELESTDTDGGGTNGLIFHIPDGTDDWHFDGDAFLDKETANLPVRLNGSSQLVGQQIDGGASSTEDDILDASIPNTDLANTTVSYGGVTVSLGGSDPTPAFDLQDSTNIPEKREVQTVTIADDTTGGSSPSQQVTPSAAIVEITNNDPDGATVTLDDTAAVNGDIVWILNANGSAASLTLSDDTGNSDPTLELWTSDITLEQRELFAVEFNAAAGWWREVGRANGEVSTLADTIEGVSNPDGDIDLVPGSDISITGDDGANTITIASSLIRNLENPGGNIDIQGDGRVAVTDDGTSIITIDGGTLEGLSNAGGNIDLAGGANISISDDGTSVITLAVSPQGSGSGLDADTTDGQHLGTGDDVEHNSLTLGEFAGDKAVISNGSGRLAESTVTTNQLDIVSRVPGGREPRNGLHWKGTTDQRVEVPNDASFATSFNDGGAFRVIAKVADPSFRQTLIVIGTDVRIHIRPAPTLSFRADFTTTNGEWEFDHEVQAGEVIDVIVVYSHSGVNEDPSAWVNGESVSVTETSTPEGDPVDTSSDPLRLGETASGFHEMNGSLLHAALYNYAFKASDVEELYATGQTPHRLSSGTKENQLSSPSAFDSSDWTKSNVTVAANTAETSDPDGGNQADEITEASTADTTHAVRQSIWDTAEKKGRYVRLAVSSKPNGRNWIAVRPENTSNRSVWFDVSSGTIGTTESGVIDAQITDQGNGWFRCEVLVEHAGISPFVQMFLSDMDGALTYDGDGTSGVYLYKAVAEPLGQTVRLNLDEGIGFQVHDESGNANHGAFNSTDSPVWIKQEDHGQVRTVGATANQSLLNTTVEALPANVLIESIAVASSSTDAPGDFWVGTASETVSDNAITIPEDIGASEHVSFQIIDTLPGQGSRQDLFINSDDWGEETLDIVVNYSRYENNF